MEKNMQTEIYRGYGKALKISAQTAAQCRFSEPIETVIATHANVALTGVEAASGEVRYFGKVHFIMVYADGEKHICRAEKGVEFTARAENEGVFPAMKAQASLAAENISLKREGAGVTLTALIGADISLYADETFEYLTGGDIILKREPVSVFAAHLFGGSAETEDDFETEPLGDILMHSETAGAPEITVNAGSVCLEGEVNVSILALKDEGGLLSFERLVPYRIEIPCEGALPGRGAEARVSVPDVSIHAETDEEKRRCKITATVLLSAEGSVFEEQTIEVATDAFSRTHEVKLTYSEAETAGMGAPYFLSERVSGKAALSSKIDFSDTLLSVTLARAEANTVYGAEGARLEGVAMATLIVRGADGDVRGLEMSLPFSVSAEEAGDTVSVMACSMSARQKQEGEIDAEATLKFSVSRKALSHIKFISAAEEGEEAPVSDSAISIYLPRAGDGLWEIGKALKKAPEEVAAGNPGLELPVKAGQRVVIYRKKSLT